MIKNNCFNICLFITSYKKTIRFYTHLLVARKSYSDFYCSDFFFKSHSFSSERFLGLFLVCPFSQDQAETVKPHISSLVPYVICQFTLDVAVQRFKNTSKPLIHVKVFIYYRTRSYVSWAGKLYSIGQEARFSECTYRIAT